MKFVALASLTLALGIAGLAAGCGGSSGYAGVSQGDAIRGAASWWSDSIHAKGRLLVSMAADGRSFTVDDAGKMTTVSVFDITKSKTSYGRDAWSIVYRVRGRPYCVWVWGTGGGAQAFMANPACV